MEVNGTTYACGKNDFILLHPCKAYEVEACLGYLNEASSHILGKLDPK